MPILQINVTYDDSAALTESQLDTAFASITTWANTTKLDSSNIQTGGIATAALADGAVTAAKLASEAVTTAKIADLAITTAKIADAAVTRAKLEEVGQQVSSSSGAYTTSSTSFVTPTNLSVSLTTAGRPVRLEIIPDGTSGPSVITTATGSQFQFTEDGTGQGICSSSNSTSYPASAFTQVVFPAAGTYTYAFQGKSSSGTLAVSYVKLVAYEL